MAQSWANSDTVSIQAGQHIELWSNALDEWIRHKLRCLRLKQRKRTGPIAEFLHQLGVPKWRAWIGALGGKGCVVEIWIFHPDRRERSGVASHLAESCLQRTLLDGAGGLLGFKEAFNQFGLRQVSCS